MLHVCPCKRFHCLIFPYLLKTMVLPLRIYWKLSTILKTSNKSVWSIVFWYVKVYIFWKFNQSTIHRDKTQMLTKYPSDKINVTKKHSFFFREPQPITVSIFIRNFYTSWSAWFISLKLCVGFSIFDFVSFLLNFIFLFSNMYGLFDLQTSNSFQ